MLFTEEIDESRLRVRLST